MGVQASVEVWVLVWVGVVGVLFWDGVVVLFWVLGVVLF